MRPEPRRRAGTLDEHRDIAAAVRSRKMEKAETAMRKHLERVDQESRSFAEANPKLIREG
ncbi:MAG: FCD domain-containing protein [Parvibaculaceae bacterium]